MQRQCQVTQKTQALCPEMGIKNILRRVKGGDYGIPRHKFVNKLFRGLSIFTFYNKLNRVLKD